MRAPTAGADVISAREMCFSMASARAAPARVRATRWRAPVRSL
jgi:hypothetical protein